MIIPLGTDRAVRRPTVVNHALLAVNAAAFLALLLVVALNPGSDLATGRGPVPDAVMDRFALVWKPSEPWRFVTYAFLHGGWWHVLGNMLFLYVFGPSVEDRLGRAGYLAFYLFAGAAAGAAHLMLHPQIKLIGASGAIAGVTGAFAVFFPRTNIRLFIFFILVGAISVPALWFIGFAVLRDLLGLGMKDQVSQLAHLGGYAFGFVVSLMLLVTKVVPREAFDLFSVFKRRLRLSEIRGAAEIAEDRTRRVRRGEKELEEEKPMPEEVATARADIASRLARGDAPGAAGIYAKLLQVARDQPKYATLSRHAHLAVANELLARGEHAPSARAYGLYIDAYPRDGQTPHVRLMAGLIHARYLNDPARARELIQAAMPGLREAEDLDLAKQLLEELGRASVGR